MPDLKQKPDNYLPIRSEDAPTGVDWSFVAQCLARTTATDEYAVRSELNVYTVAAGIPALAGEWQAARNRLRTYLKTGVLIPSRKEGRK